MTQPALLNRFTLAILGALLFGLPFFLVSCNRTDEDGNPRFKCDKSEPDTADEAWFSFLFVDAADNEVLPLSAWYYPCHRDSVMVYKENGEPAVNFSMNNSGRVGFSVIEFSEDHTNTFINEQQREFYLYVNYRHIDTFRFEYKFLETDCNYVVFDYARVYYNDALIIDHEKKTRFGGPEIFIDSLRYNPCPN